MLSPDVRVNSYTEIDNSIIFSHVNIGRTAGFAARLSIATCIFLKAPSLASIAKRTKEYFVTENGITVVTRDYSLFENPVTVDYFTSE